MAIKAKTKLKPRGRAFVKGHDVKSPGAPVKEWRVSTWIEKELSVEDYNAKVTNAQLIAKNLVAKAKANDPDALAHMKEVMDRTEGKPQQNTDITSKGERIVLPILGGESLNDELSTGEEK